MSVIFFVAAPAFTGCYSRDWLTRKSIELRCISEDYYMHLEATRGIVRLRIPSSYYG